MRAPTGPAPATAVPLPMNRPVPIVPPETTALAPTSSNPSYSGLSLTNGNHLQMATLQLSLQIRHGVGVAIRAMLLVVDLIAILLGRRPCNGSLGLHVSLLRARRFPSLVCSHLPERLGVRCIWEDQIGGAGAESEMRQEVALSPLGHTCKGADASESYCGETRDAVKPYFLDRRRMENVR